VDLLRDGVAERAQRALERHQAHRRDQALERAADEQQDRAVELELLELFLDVLAAGDQRLLRDVFEDRASDPSQPEYDTPNALARLILRRSRREYSLKNEDLLMIGLAFLVSRGRITSSRRFS
jgi:hypothetical protein